jgi:hypothetical protein
MSENLPFWQKPYGTANDSPRPAAANNPAWAVAWQ